MLGGMKRAMLTIKFANRHKQSAQLEKHGAGCKGATQQRMQRYFTCTCERSMSSVFKLASTALALAFGTRPSMTLHDLGDASVRGW
jgi:hypothetical protein